MNPLKKFAYENLIPLFGKMNSKKNRFAGMIYYHDIVRENGYSYMQINKEKFISQMEYIKEKGYKTLLFEDLNENAGFQKNAVLIAFDDGWVSNYTEIFEYMKENNIKYNIFLAAGSIGTDENYLTEEMVKEMAQSKIVSFGAHTFDHVTLEDISKIDTARQFDLTNKKIAEWTGKEPVDICFPKGIYTKESLEEMLKSSPYKRFWTSKLQYSEEIGGKIVFGRAAISNDEPFSVFKSKLKGYYNCFSILKGKKGF